MVTKWKKLISENIATVKEVLENVDIDKDIFFLEGGSSFVMFFLWNIDIEKYCIDKNLA